MIQAAQGSVCTSDVRLGSETSCGLWSCPILRQAVVSRFAWRSLAKTGSSYCTMSLAQVGE
eukprot:6090216-Amphidinium_carterae.1